MMKKAVLGAVLLTAVIGCRNASSAEVNKALQNLSQTVEEPTMALEPEAETGDGEAVRVGDVVEFDKTVHDFGDVCVTDGPLTCTFTVRNIGKEPVAIYEVVTSCGCTDAKWTREPLQSGKTGTITATYKNEDGATPFDKTLTVYIAGVGKPVILRMRGFVHEKKQPVSVLYGEKRIGDLGLKARSFRLPDVLQGEASSDEAKVANLGRKPLTVTFTNLTPGLSVKAVPSTIPAGKTGTIVYTVHSAPDVWGRHTYQATPVLNGRKAGKPLSFTALTRGNFAAWTPEQRKNAPLCLFDESTLSFGTVKPGARVQSVFTFTNKGKSALKLYSLDAETEGVLATLPPETQPGKKGSILVILDTSSLPAGENVIMLTLTTNCPDRPVVNLFLTGLVK